MKSDYKKYKKDVLTEIAIKATGIKSASNLKKMIKLNFNLKSNAIEAAKTLIAINKNKQQ